MNNISRKMTRIDSTISESTQTQEKNSIHTNDEFVHIPTRKEVKRDICRQSMVDQCQKILGNSFVQKSAKSAISAATYAANHWVPEFTQSLTQRVEAGLSDQIRQMNLPPLIEGALHEYTRMGLTFADQYISESTKKLGAHTIGATDSFFEPENVRKTCITLANQVEDFLCPQYKQAYRNLRQEQESTNIKLEDTTEEFEDGTTSEFVLVHVDP